MNMEKKFKEIDQFINQLESTNVINEDEQALLLVGGAGIVEKTNTECENFVCDKDDTANNRCNNTICY